MLLIFKALKVVKISFFMRNLLRILSLNFWLIIIVLQFLLTFSLILKILLIFVLVVIYFFSVYFLIFFEKIVGLLLDVTSCIFSYRLSLFANLLNTNSNFLPKVLEYWLWLRSFRFLLWRVIFVG